MSDDTSNMNGARMVACFYCNNSEYLHQHVEKDGKFYPQYKCRKNLSMPDHQYPRSDVEIVLECPGGDPRYGFQIGGYYTHMWFERDEPNSCLEWMIASDGEFPSQNGEPEISFHICNFKQIERFVEFWGKELRRRGWIVDEKN